MNTTEKTAVQIAQEQLAAAEEAARRNTAVEEARKALEAAVAAEREAKREAERQQRLAAERAKMAVRNSKALAIAQALTAAGVTASYIEPSESESCGKIMLECGVPIALEAETTGSRWHSHETGRYKVCVGANYSAFEGVRRYPPKQDGTYNIAKIAATIKEMVAHRDAVIARKRAEKTREEQATALAAALNTEAGLTNDIVSGYLSYRNYDNRYTTTYPASGKVYVALGTREMTPEQARRLIAAMIEIGLVSKKPAA